LRGLIPAANELFQQLPVQLPVAYFRTVAPEGCLNRATWGDGTTGITGAVDVSNSLVGAILIGCCTGITALTNGNYMVSSRGWNSNRGAATWGDGKVGSTGTVDATNSLVGSSVNDQVGFDVTALSNGSYVVFAWIDSEVFRLSHNLTWIGQAHESRADWVFNSIVAKFRSIATSSPKETRNFDTVVNTSSEISLFLLARVIEDLPRIALPFRQRSPVAGPFRLVGLRPRNFSLW
jgi:hypothetical protein